MMDRCGCENGGDCARISVCTAEAMVEDAVEELQRKHSELVDGVQKYLDGDYPRANKYEQCAHERYGYEGCEQCVDEYLSTLLEQEVRDE